MRQSQLAKKIATLAHAGQFRRDNKTPYIKHPASVAEWLNGKSDETIAVAWLHDVLEDTNESVSSLMDKGVSKPVLRAVFLLSKNLSGHDVGDYLNRIKQNELATIVKIADMICNLADKPTMDQIKKYSSRITFLTS